MQIKLTCRQIIDQNNLSGLGRDIWNDAWEEFCLQSQRYYREGQLQTFEEMAGDDPKANSLHYKVGFAVGLHINNLGGLTPGWFDNLGRAQIPFESCELKIIRADLRSRKDFRLALFFTTPSLRLWGTPGMFYWVSLPQENNLVHWMPSILVEMEPGIAPSLVSEIPFDEAASYGTETRMLYQEGKERNQAMNT